MYKIYKITSNTTVDFAAEELKKYLRMMMPEANEIAIKYDPEAKDGLRLGLMSDFGLDTSEAEDLFLDDIIHIDTDGENGIIAGSNPRSVLLAVYRYLQENGCRWLFPGIDGEFIPVKDVAATKYHKMADCRFRGQCNEGAEFQSNMMEVIDFTPKIGLNIFMIEFFNPRGYYNSFYDHKFNPAREKNPLTTVLRCSGSASARQRSASADCSSTIWDTAGLPSPSVSPPPRDGLRITAQRSPRKHVSISLSTTESAIFIRALLSIRSSVCRIPRQEPSLPNTS